MDKPVHSYTELFTQLGFLSPEDAIRKSLAQHRLLAEETVLADAPFWVGAQPDFLRKKWVEVALVVHAIDPLNVALRGNAKHA